MFRKNYCFLFTSSKVSSIQHAAKQKYHTNSNKQILHPSLDFPSDLLLKESHLYRKLCLLFTNYYQLNPYDIPALRTISMKATLKYLGLSWLYREYIDEHKVLIGIHGTSETSLSATAPYLSGIKNMQTFHNPNSHEQRKPNFYFSDSVHTALHYSKLNSISTEIINPKSDPDHYPRRILLLGFANQSLVEEINRSGQKEFIIQQTDAWVQRRNGIPEDYRLGNELRIPKDHHNRIVNLICVSMQGTQRPAPLHIGTQYYNGKQCIWKSNVGYADYNTGQSLIQNEFRENNDAQMINRTTLRLKK